MIKLRIKRIAKQPTYTIGKLYIDDKYYCDTLEDKDRGLKQTDSLVSIKSHKIYGKTAIPTGEYYVNLTYSPKFKRILPVIQNVKGYEGIRIHSGNTADDTEGCILVGYNTVKGMVVKSKATLENILKILLQGDDKIIITIE